MKHKNSFLFALLMLAASALAQTTDSQNTGAPKNDLPKDDLPKQVVLARCAYGQADAVCASERGASASDRGTNTTRAQMPRQYPGPMAGPPMRGPSYSGMWMSQPSPAHVLIGGGIGLAIGVALAARGNAGVGGTLGIGALFGLIGAGIGATTPSFPSRHYYRHRWPDQDEEASLSKRDPSKRGPGKSEQAKLEQTKLDQAKLDQANLDSARQTTPPPSPSATGADSPLPLLAETP